MKWFLASLALPLSLSALETIVEVGVDYRADNYETTMNRKLQNLSTTQELKLREVDIWEVGGKAFVNLPYCFVVGFEGKYGFVTDGRLEFQELFDVQPQQMHFNTFQVNNLSGHTCDLIGVLGYSLRDACSCLILTPEVGYSYYSNDYDNMTSNLTPAPEEFPLIGDPKVGLDYHYHGPWIGFQGAYQPFPCIFLYGTLRYNWMQYRGHGSTNYTFQMDDINTLVHTDFSDKGRARGPVIRVGTDYQMFCSFAMGLLFEYRYFNTIDAHRDETERVLVTQNGQTVSDTQSQEENRLNHVRSKTWYIGLNANYRF